MNLRFFGGANEVGASSTLIEIEGVRLLVDAGIRMGTGQDSPLPNFPDFDQVGMPDAVLLTHAHTDHTGALPVLRDLWCEGVKLYWTLATKAISRVLLEDSANRMQREQEKEEKPPLYTREDLEGFLHCMQTEVPWCEPVPICGNIKATWIPAGHILGAAMIYIQGERESILMTGDVSATAQLTIPRMAKKLPYQPDVMVMESTYGDPQHESDRSRLQEVERLTADVAKTIAAGGKVLIPAFAVGRSQEVILILKRAMEHKQIPEFPVHVDGMVQDVNDVYSRFCNELSPSLHRKAKRDENIFYSEVIKPVRKNVDRDSVSSWDPCCIVASSGMLNGGRSNSYAQYLAKDPKNLIAITGYQAKGNAGRALWDWVEASKPSDWMWYLKDQEPMRVKCEVKKYSLSAHADSQELLELVERVQPRQLFLVHGNEKARREFFKSVGKKFPDIDVERPENGLTYTVEKQVGIANGRRLPCDRILFEVFAFVRNMERKGPFRVRELTEIWFGTDATTQMAVKFLQWCLLLDIQYFKRGSDDLFYLRQPV